MYSKDNEKESKLEIIIKGLIAIFNFVSLILLIVWLFKIICNAEKEPWFRGNFIANDSLQNYTEGDFCYGRKYEYTRIGALRLFNIQMDEIKKYAKALLVTKFVSIGLVIYASLLRICFADRLEQYCEILEKKYFKRIKRKYFFSISVIIPYIANNILNVIFLEKLSDYYSDSNFYDFERYSKCDYMQKNFKRKYKFVTTVKKNCNKVFIVNMISSILEAINIF